MATQAEKYHLVIGGAFGTPFIAKLQKSESNVGVMSSDRRVVPEDEFIDAIERWAIHKLKEGHSVLEITNEIDEVVIRIEFPLLKE